MLRLKILLFVMLASVISTKAQDIIVCTDGSAIAAKVEKITSSKIEYKKFTNLNGPLYSIPITSVVSVTYENGSKESFNNGAITPAQTSASSNAYPSVMQNSNKLSDADLLRAYRESYGEKNDYLRKYKRYRAIGWIGGILIAGCGGVGIAASGDSEAVYYIVLPCTIGAIAWTGGWLYAAHAQKRKYEDLILLSASVYEQEIIKVGNSSLMAGIDVFNNTMTRQPGIGVGLRLNF